MADQLAKATTRNRDIAVSFNRIPTSTFYSEIKEMVIQKWQKDWDKCTKAAITKEFFPNVRDRLKMKISITQILRPWLLGTEELGRTSTGSS